VIFKILKNRIKRNRNAAAIQKIPCWLFSQIEVAVLKDAGAISNHKMPKPEIGSVGGYFCQRVKLRHADAYFSLPRNLSK